MHLPSFLGYFKALEDPRQLGKVRYPLSELLLLALCAVICGADTFADIADYGRSKLPFLRTFLPFQQGIPSHDTLNDVFSALNPTLFAQCFSDWVNSLRQHLPDTIAIDGKTLRHSFDENHPPIHMVSAWASQQRLVLGQVKVSEKSNEITAIPQLLQLLTLSGATVTIDAMGCQHAIAQQIVEQEADYVLALKGNHMGLYTDVVAFVTEQEKTGFKHSQWQHCQGIEKGHGRLEDRRYGSCGDVAWLRERYPAWATIQSVAWVDSRRSTGEEVSGWERRYYVSSLQEDAEQVASAIRGHWGIENGLHWVLDVVFGDDQSRVRSGNGAENLHRVKQMALTMITQSKGKTSIRLRRKQAGWNDTILFSILKGQL